MNNAIEADARRRIGKPTPYLPIQAGWPGALLALLLLPSPTLAQSILTTPDGTGTIVTTNGETHHIEGGTQTEANLFHSFTTFGLSEGEVANFLSNPSVSHIFGRVTGGEPSVINGLMQVTGSDASLYLMNPAGMVFGPGASLNIGGDFVATTSDRIGFSHGWFNATGTNDYTTLEGTPNQFAFVSETPGTILNLGDLSNAQDVSLFGGTVLNQGQVISQEGGVTIAAVPGERLVKLSQPGMLLSLELPRETLTAGIKPVELSTVLTGSGIAGDAIAPGDVGISGAVAGQQVDLYAAGQVTATDTDSVTHSVQGDTRVIRFSKTGENPHQAVFIDARADQPDALLFGAEAGTVSQIIEREEDGIAIVTEQLAEISEAVGELDSVAIVAEGHEGNFWLGNQWVRHENITDYAAQLQNWGQALTENADLLLYSCFTALGATGEALIASIADLTGADVAASVDATGSANYGADWELETNIGDIEANNPFTSATLTDWDGKLASLTVTDFGDIGLGDTLRNQIGVAMDGDTVVFASAATVTLTMGEISWTTSNLTIDGNGGTVSGNNAHRVLGTTAANVTLKNLTVQAGTALNDGGAGIEHDGTGTLTLENVVFSGNTADKSGGAINSEGEVILIDSTVVGNASNDGGGIKSEGNIVLIRSTVSGNTATSGGMAARGGGIFANGSNVTLINSTVSGNVVRASGGPSPTRGGGIFSERDVTLINSTVAFNTADSGGGIYVQGTYSNRIVNSIIANNSATNPDLQADLSSSTVQHSLITDTTGITGLTLTTGVNGNIIGQDPQLGPLQNNGGFTQTHALAATSPAINAGSNDLAFDTSNVALSIDQAGNLRIVDAAVDMGAYEYQRVITVDVSSCDANVSCTTVTTAVPSLPELRSTDQILSTGTVESLERSASNDYADLTPQNATPLTIAQSQAILQDVANQTGIKPALLYLTFTPSNVATGMETNELLLASRVHNALNGVEWGQVPGRDRDDQLQLVLVAPDGKPISKQLPGITRGQVNQQVQRFQRSLLRLSAGQRYLRPAQQLYDWLIRPMQPELTALEINNLAVIADEGLRGVPYAALHDGAQFLVENYSVGLMPSLSLVDSRYRPLQQPKVLAMGASDFDSLGPLPAVPTELALITQGQAQVPYLNSEFTAANLRELSRDRQFQVLHLATHAVFQAGHPEQAYVQLWGDERLQLNSFRELRFYDEPALELLILSACQTALGDTKAELGFAGASLQAGVKSVLASLWEVSDLGTMRLMSEFYAQLAQPEVTIKAEALRQAQLGLLQGTATLQDGFLGDLPLSPEVTQYQSQTDLSHPYYWSAFTLVGSPW